MGLMPKKKIEQLGECEAHVVPFTTNAVAIGSSTTATTDFSTKTTAARAAYVIKQAAEEALRNANGNFDMALQSATDSFANIVKSVRAKAAVSGDSIYTLASLPIPATPGPVGNPGTPTDLKIGLNPDGSIKLSYKCPNPAGSTGVLYHVFRSSTGETGSYEFVGAAGARTFTDESVPSGLTIIYYKIQAIRTSAAGVAAEFMVRFGTGGGSGSGISVTAMAPKLAA